jgi:uncharacterized protein (DUF952 family)
MNCTDNPLIYKMTTAVEWARAEALGRFTGSADDVRDGYIHLSARDQLEATAAKYYADVAGLVLVAFAPVALGAALVWEASRGGALFPHYYGALPVSAALWVRPLPLDSAGIPRCADALEA